MVVWAQASERQLERGGHSHIFIIRLIVSMPERPKQKACGVAPLFAPRRDPKSARAGLREHHSIPRYYTTGLKALTSRPDQAQSPPEALVISRASSDRYCADKSKRDTHDEAAHTIPLRNQPTSEAFQALWSVPSINIALPSDWITAY